MMETNLKPRRKRRIGRPPKHGGLSLVYRADLVKEHPELRRYLQDCRDGLIDDLAAGDEDALTTGQRILVDRTIQKLSLARLIEIYITKTGVLRRDRLNSKVLEVEPILIYWQSLNHAIRSDLAILGLKRAEITEPEPALQVYLASKKKTMKDTDQPEKIDPGASQSVGQDKGDKP